MKQGLTKTRTKVRLLTDPKPSYMSVVDHGANQTPFRTIKSAKPVAAGDKQMPIKKRNVKKDAVQDNDAVESGVVKLEFAKSEFASKEAVENWLSSHKWSDYTIVEDGDNFVAKSSGDAKYEKVTPVSIEKGLVGFVGKGLILPESEDEDEEDESDESENTAKGAAPERALKLDFYDLYYTSETSPAAAIADAMKSNPLPPGAEDIIFATQRAMMNALKSDKSVDEKKTDLKAVGAEMGDLMGRMYEVFAKIADDEEASKSEKGAEFIERTKKEMEAMEAGVLGKAAEPAGEVTEPTLQAPVSKTQEPAATEEAKPLDLSALSGMIAKTVADTMKPIGDQVSALSKKLNEVQTTAKAASEAASKAADDLKAFKSAAPTRKSAGEVEMTTKGAKQLTEAETADKAESERTIKSILGVL